MWEEGQGDLIEKVTFEMKMQKLVFQSPEMPYNVPQASCLKQQKWSASRSEARSPRPRRLQGRALCRCQGRFSSRPPSWLWGVPWLVAPELHPGMGVSLSGVYVCVPVSPLIRTSSWMRIYPSDLVFT